MSRIHEALKKAATERSGLLADGPASELVELARTGLVEGGIAEEVAGVSGKSLGNSGEPSRGGYAELLKKCRRTEWNINPRFSVFADETRFRHGAERFRTLRSRLYQIAATRPLKRILVTSSVPLEGKTFIASNLAQSLIRQENQKVLLIDADLRASRLHLTLGAPAAPGLSDYLRGEADEYAVTQNGQKGNFFFIPGGNEVSNPSELLLSERMGKLLELVTPLFDWVILDSPPALPVHDASMLADLCDGVLFVLRGGSTSFEVAEKASSKFPENKLLGVVLNRAEKAATLGDYYYGYTSGEENRQK